MFRRIGFLAIASLIVVAGCSGGPAPETVNENPKTEAPKVADEPQAGAVSAEVKFAEVQTILQTSCFACHKGEGAKEGLDMSTYESLMKGSEHGPVVAAGDPESSLIVKALRGKGAKQMPMMGDPLPEEQIAKIETWIKAGAKND